MASIQIPATGVDPLRIAYERLEVVYRMTAAVARAPGLAEIYREALDALIGVLRADRASILLFDPDGVMRFKAWRGISDAYRAAVEGHSPWRPDSPDPTTIVVPDVVRDPALADYRATFAAEGLRALVFVPLVQGDRVIGKFMVYFDSPRELDDAELALLEAIAGHVVFAIERHRTSDALRRKTLEFETLAENAPDIIARFDANLRHVYVNPAVEEATGRPRDEFLGRTNEELGMPPHLVAKWNEMIHRVFSSAETAHHDFSYIRDGERRYFEAVVVPERGDDGRVAFALSMTRDVTGRVRSAFRQRVLAQATDVLISSLDVRAMLDGVAWLIVDTVADGCAVDVVSATDGALDRVALITRDPAKAELVRELEAKFPTMPDAPAGHVHALRTGQAALYATIPDELLRAASTCDEHFELWKEIGMQSVICVPLRARGRTLGVITIVSHDAQQRFTQDDLDLAEELAARVALAVDNVRLFQEAVHANRAKSTFLATMSHELRTPLNAILGYSDLMDLGVGGKLAHTQRDHIGRIQASARHLLTLIEGVLAFSRLEGGVESVRTDRIDVRSLAEEAIDLVRPGAAAKEILLGIELSQERIEVDTDPSKVLQILLNLLGNAVKFTPPHGSVILEVCEAQDEAVLRVRDDGEGIAPEHLERIFEPFWQVEQGRTRRSGGTGLGLTVSRQLAELLGGSLRAESALGSGSTFTLQLPLVAQPTPTSVPQTMT